VATGEKIPGYAYGHEDVVRSPVSLTDLEDLKRAVVFGPEDERALRELWSVVADRRDELFETWMGRIAHFFLPTFAGPQGTPDQAYLEAAHPRFMKWIEDTCTRPHDQVWLDYQHEIGLRHHRAKKNRTDGVESVEIVPFRYLPIALYSFTSTLHPLLVQAGIDDARAERLAGAWAKSVTLQVTLWSYPYVNQGDW
jgi:protoglobin